MCTPCRLYIGSGTKCGFTFDYCQASATGAKCEITFEAGGVSVMAKKSALVAGLANALGMPMGQISLFYRFLNEAELLTSTGARGVNAPDLSVLDCARLLIAVLATERPSAAPQAVADFGRLPLTATLSFDADRKPTVEDGDPLISAEIYLASFIRDLAALPSDEAERRCHLAAIKCTPRLVQIEVFTEIGTVYFDDSAAFETDEGQDRISRHFKRLDVTRAVIGPPIAEIAAIFRGQANG